MFNSNTIKILDARELEQAFLPLRKRHDAIGNWMFRHGKFDRSSATLIINIYRNLKKEGFE